MEINTVQIMDNSIKRTYTLIELLVVVSIMALLLGIGLPAFNAMTKGQGVNAAAREVGAILRMTQAFAIGNNKYAAVIFAGRGSDTSPNDVLDLKYNLRSFRPCVIEKTSSGNLEFDSWVSGTQWRFLPVGTMMCYSTASPYPVYDTQSVQKVDFSDITSTSGANSVTVNNMAVVYGPSGSLAKCNSLSYSPTLYIREGAYTSGKAVVTNADNKMMLQINQYTGRITYE